MYIYKITVVPLDKVYIGLDTAPSYKLSRWAKHQSSANGNSKTKLHTAMRLHGMNQCKIEIIEDGFSTIGSLALAEIEYIKKFNSYRKGLNSTPGGDGLGRADLTKVTEDELRQIKEALSDNLTKYNKNIKWADTTLAERKELTKHLHTEKIYAKKSATLKKFYESNPNAKKEKGKDIKKWQQDNQQQLKTINKINGAKGAAKVSKKLKVETEDGKVLYFSSKSEFNRATGQWAATILQKTKEGKFYNGYKAMEV